MRAFENIFFFLQLWMVVGARGLLGQSALTAAVEENKQILALVPILPQQMAEKTAREKIRIRSHVIRTIVVSPVVGLIAGPTE